MQITKTLFLFLTIAGLATGCEAPGVGDPCNPEATPEGGFISSEAYLETSSVQCRTRVCMVYKFDGDPTQSRESCLRMLPDGADPTPCTTLFRPETELLEHVHCTCRCAVPGGAADAPVCECGEGFVCTEVLAQGGVGIQGSYCVSAAVAPAG